MWLEHCVMDIFLSKNIPVRRDSPMFRWMKSIALACVVIQGIAPFGEDALGKARPQVEDNDQLYFPGVSLRAPVGGANNIVSFSRTGNNIAGSLVGMSVGTATRAIATSQPGTAVSHVPAILGGLSPTTQTEVRTLAIKHPTKLQQQLRTAQQSIGFYSGKCKANTAVMQCVGAALDFAITKTPEPIKTVLKAVKKAVSTPNGLIKVMTDACPIMQRIWVSPGACTAIAALVKWMTTKGGSTSSGEKERRQKPAQVRDEKEKEEARCEEDKDVFPGVADSFMAFRKILSRDVRANIESTTHVKTLVICVQNGLGTNQSDAKEIADEFQTVIFPLVTSITGKVHDSKYIYLKICKMCNKVAGFYTYRGEKNHIYIKYDPGEVGPHYFTFVAHEYAHMMDRWVWVKPNLKSPIWITKFRREGFATFVESEYRQRKNIILMYGHLKKNIIKLVEFLESTAKAYSISNVKTPRCFLDAPDEAFLRLSEDDKHRVHFQISTLFMEYVSEKFDIKSRNGVRNANKNKTYKIFDFLTSESAQDKPYFGLKIKTENDLRESWEQFCAGFTDYLKTGL
jgi:hypothetical protein